MGQQLKRQLLEFCQLYVQSKLTTLETALAHAQQSANNEEKSSMGDKYETGRAMAQLEIENNSKRLAEVRQETALLARVPLQDTTTVQTGSVIETNLGNFFIAIPAGKAIIGSQSYQCISASSPLCQVLKGLKAGQHVEWNGKSIEILTVL